MKKSMILLAGPAYLLVLAGLTCTRFEQKPKEHQAYFWKRTDSAATYFLYVDNDLRGVLPFNPEATPAINTQNVVDRALLVTMTSGEHRLLAKDKAGNVYLAGTVLMQASDAGPLPAISVEQSTGSIEIACTR